MDEAAWDAAYKMLYFTYYPRPHTLATPPSPALTPSPTPKRGTPSPTQKEEAKALTKTARDERCNTFCTETEGCNHWVMSHDGTKCEARGIPYGVLSGSHAVAPTMMKKKYADVDKPPIVTTWLGRPTKATGEGLTGCAHPRAPLHAVPFSVSIGLPCGAPPPLFERSSGPSPHPRAAISLRPLASRPPHTLSVRACVRRFKIAGTVLFTLALTSADATLADAECHEACKDMALCTFWTRTVGKKLCV